MESPTDGTGVGTGLGTSDDGEEGGVLDAAFSDDGAADASGSGADGAAIDAGSSDSAVDSAIGRDDAASAGDGGADASSGDEAAPVDAASSDAGDVGDEGNDQSPDAAEAATSMPEAAAADAPPTPTCDPNAPFGAPALVAGLASTSTEGGLRLSPDELTGYFWSTRPGGPGDVNLYVATRASLLAPFGSATLLAGVNTTGSQYDPTVTADGLTLFFGSNRASADGSYDLFQATRPSTADEFSQVSTLTLLNTTSNDQQPFVLPDGSELYFSSDRSGASKIYRALSAAGQLLAPTQLIELDAAGGTSANDQHPTASVDDRVLVFSSNRDGGLGDLDVWMATRTNTALPFGAPVDLTSVNSSGKEIPDFISADGCRLYLHIDPQDSGEPHEFVATRP